MLIGFIPGKHCTQCQVKGVLTVLEDYPPHREPLYPYVCPSCLPRVLAGKYRSDNAKRAVATKRRRYTTWPTRRGDHARRNEGGSR